MSTNHLQPPPDQNHRERFFRMLQVAMSRPALVALLLVMITLAVFGRTAGFDFTNCDDPDYFTTNLHVRTGLSWDNIIWAFREAYAANWHPLTWISLMADASLFGTDGWGPHFTNALLHALATALLFLFLRDATGAHWRSALVAALFALHPQHVESVAWVAERKDVLSAFFGFLSLIFYVRYAQSKIPRSSSAIQNYCLALLCFALGLMSKPMLVTLPFVLLLLDCWPLARASGFEFRVSSWKKLVVEKIPFFLLSAASSVVTFYVQRAGKAVVDLEHLSATTRLENVLVSYARYLGKLFWPFDLAIMYPYAGKWPWAWVVFSAFLIAGLCWVAWSLRRPYVLVGWCWFLGTLVPVIGLVQVGLQSMADRYSYIPSIGIFIIVVWGIGEAVQRWRVPKLATAAALILLAACAARTTDQLSSWKNTETLFRHALAVTRGNYFAHNNLGCYLRGNGNYTEATEQFEAALKIYPDNADVLNNYGYLFTIQDQHDKATKLYESSLRANPDHPSARENLAEAFFKTGKLERAREEYLAVLKAKPDHADTHNRLGVVLVSLNRVDEAREHFQEALRLNPDFAAAHCNLGNSLAAQRKFDDAIRHFREALRINPDYAEAQNNLGGALEEKGSLQEALPCYREAVRLKKDYAQAHFNLGSLLAQLGHRQEGIAHLAEAVRLKPDYTKAKKQLQELEAQTRP